MVPKVNERTLCLWGQTPGITCPWIQEGRRAPPFYLGSTAMLTATEVTPVGTYLSQGAGMDMC